MKSQTEIEVKFLVPPAARASVAAEMARQSGTLGRTSLTAIYLDTDDRRLARAGMAWRLRREGRRWIQALKAGTSNALERFEHEVIRPDASPDPSAHTGTAQGDQLISLLRRARADGVEAGERFRSEIRRTTRRIRTRGALVEVAFDEGRLVSTDRRLRVREIEFELVSGSPVAMLVLAERWRKRFGLIYDPRSKAERGDGLAEGSPFPSVRKAKRPSYSHDTAAIDAFGLVLDECLEQITRNAIGLIDGNPGHRIEHVHQLRVGIRRLRSALRSFRGWVPPPPEQLEQRLRSLFLELGLSRDSDVLVGGVGAELNRVGAPPLTLPAVPAGPDPADAMKSADTQQTLLAWITWRAALAPSAAGAPRDAGTRPMAEQGQAATTAERAAPPQEGGPADASSTPAPCQNSRSFPRTVERRLRRWHARIVSDWKSFDGLDEAGLHALRKRIKRQRYAVEFFAPVLRKRQMERYLDALAAVQDRMGALNDGIVARARYQVLVATDPAAWFALGWLTARIAEWRALAKPELGKLAKAGPPAT